MLMTVISIISPVLMQVIMIEITEMIRIKSIPIIVCKLHGK